MKSKLIEKQEKHNYPCLKESVQESGGKIIVFFTKPKCGVVIYSTWDCGNSMGEWSNAWNEEKFHIYSGEITLSNE